MVNDILKKITISSGPVTDFEGNPVDESVAWDISNQPGCTRYKATYSLYCSFILDDKQDSEIFKMLKENAAQAINRHLYGWVERELHQLMKIVSIGGRREAQLKVAEILNKIRGRDE